MVRLAAEMQRARGGRQCHFLRMICLHHPIEHPTLPEKKRPWFKMRLENERAVMDFLSQSPWDDGPRAHLVLSGHVHWHHPLRGQAPEGVLVDSTTHLSSGSLLQGLIRLADGTTAPNLTKAHELGGATPVEAAQRLRQFTLLRFSFLPDQSWRDRQVLVEREIAAMPFPVPDLDFRRWLLPVGPFAMLAGDSTHEGSPRSVDRFQLSLRRGP